ncbi:hypothetical protein EB72_26825 [Mycobacterium sp. SWH-M1]|nr:hypothetical protein EB72_26825 [Mycobacterium sp. SWH-M1]
MPVHEPSARPAGRARRSSCPVQLGPITDEDAAEVAHFLQVHHNSRVPWLRAFSAVPWSVRAPNHGFMLRDAGRVVGTLLALYSERLVDGRMERFCNLGSWCVLPEYRSRSLALLEALLEQEAYHFTVLSPNEDSQEILAWFKFRPLNCSAVVVPHFPLPTPLHRTVIVTYPPSINKLLRSTDLTLYRDHARASAAHHLVIMRGGRTCYVMYRESRHTTGARTAVLLHVSDPDLFHQEVIPLTRHLLLRHGLVATVADLQLIGHKPRLAIGTQRRPRMFRSATLSPEQIDELYSELVCIPL